jgi:hypothetical protein
MRYLIITFLIGIIIGCLIDNRKLTKTVEKQQNKIDSLTTKNK